MKTAVRSIVIDYDKIQPITIASNIMPNDYMTLEEFRIEAKASLKNILSIK
ncbi:MAG: hypothetical protein LBN95_11040 [Prevotellaceae bacterium]|jgi:hypothetical protein|nr:hypothetical protein [Prevotellaceae bacterium]